MKLTSSLLLAAAAGLVRSSPVEKRQVSDGMVSHSPLFDSCIDFCTAAVLNYALTLEHLEAAFYEEGLKNYTHHDFVEAGCKDPFYSNLKQIRADEKAHEQFLTKALSGMCNQPAQERRIGC
jgi:GMP synthase PP-ATPase subunit